MQTIDSSARLRHAVGVLRHLGGHVASYGALQDSDVDFEELEGDYVTFLHPSFVDQLLSDGRITELDRAQLLALRDLISFADNSSGVVAWGNAAFRTDGFWKPVHALAVASYNSLSEASVGRLVPT